MALKPIHDRIIIKPEEAERTTASGIVLPDSAQEKPQRGKVIAVGPGPILENGEIGRMEVKVSDIILYGKYSGTEVKVGKDDLVILRQSDVLGIVEMPAKKAKTTKGGNSKKRRSGK